MTLSVLFGALSTPRCGPDWDALCRADGVDAHCETDADAVVAAVRERPVDCLVADVDAEGPVLELLGRIREVDRSLPVVLRTDDVVARTAVEVSRHHDVEYLPRSGEESADWTVPADGLVERVRSRVGLAQEHPPLQRVHEVIDDEASFEETVESLLSLGREYLGVETAFLSTVDPERDRFEVTVAQGDHELIQPGAVDSLSRTYCRRTIETEGLLAVEDAESDGWEGDPAYERYGLGTYLGGRFDVGGELFGTVCFGDRTPQKRSFSPAEEGFVELLLAWVSREAERAEHERTLRSAHDRLDEVLDRVSHGFFNVDQEFNLTYANDRFESLVGVESDPTGRSLWAVLPDAVDTAFERACTRAIERREPAEFETYLDSRGVWFQVRAYPSADGLSVYLTDVTERKRDERRLRRYQAIVESIEETVFTLDADGQFTFFNDAALTRLGVESGAVVDEPIGVLDDIDHVPTDPSVDVLRENVAAIYDGDADHRKFEMAVPVDDAPPEFRDVQLSRVELPWTGDPGSAAAGTEEVVGIARDVTERKRRERERRRYELVLETLREPVFVVDGDWRFRLVTDPLAARLGYDREQLEGRRLDAVLAADAVSTVREQVGKAPTRDGDRVEVSVETECRTEGGDRYPAEVECSVLTGGEAVTSETPLGTGEDTDREGFAGAVGTIRDISDRRQRSRDLTFFHDLVEGAAVGVTVVDADGQFEYVNEAYADLVGVDPTDVVGEDVWSISSFTESAYREQFEDLALGEELTAEYRSTRVEGAPFPAEAHLRKAEIQGERYLFGTILDVSERVKRERALSILQETARSLIETGDAERIAEVCVDAATELLPFPAAALYRFEDDRGVLNPVATSPALDDAVGDLPAIGGGDALAWTGFVEDELAYYPADAGESERPDADSGFPFESRLVVPIGNYGVLVCGAEDSPTLGAEAREFVTTLSATVEAALARTDTERELRNHEAELERRADRLERLDRINTVVRGIAETVVGADSHDEIERTVPEAVVSVDPFESAWIGQRSATAEAITVSERAGDAELGTDEFALERDGDDAHPAVSAASTGEVRIRNDLVSGGRDGDGWQRDALAAGFQSCCAIPLAHGDTVRGVLVVFANEPDAFDGEIARVLSELGEMVGYALTSLDRRTALNADTATELDFEVHDEGWFPLELATELNCRVEFGRADDGDPVSAIYLVEGTDDDAVETALGDADSVEAYEVGEVDDDAVLVSVDHVTPWFGAPILAEGGTVVDATADSDGPGELTVRVPQTTDVSSLVKVVQDRHLDVEFLARRERERAFRTPLELREVIEDRLTRKQRDALTTAFHGGYFDRPRRATGTDVADLLGVAQPTFNEHLRLAEHRTFELLFEDAGA